MNVVLEPCADATVGGRVAHVHAAVLEALSLARVPYKRRADGPTRSFPSRRRRPHANAAKSINNRVRLTERGRRRYALAYEASRNGPADERPLPAQYNWYDRYGDVPDWTGLAATERGVDSTSMAEKTHNVGAVYLMALVQGDGALLLKCFFNAHAYARGTVEAALDDVAGFLERLAADGPDAAVPRVRLRERCGDE